MKLPQKLARENADQVELYEPVMATIDERQMLYEAGLRKGLELAAEKVREGENYYGGSYGYDSRDRKIATRLRENLEALADEEVA